VQKGRIQPGRMFLVDTAQRRIVPDEELKARVATELPYAQWVEAQRVRMKDLPSAPATPLANHETLELRQNVFGYTAEVLRLLQPMVETGGEAIGSMGTDTPLAILSSRPQSLFNYFKQLFAQVTNPPVDAIREELIMAAGTTMGPEHNLFDPQAVSARQIEPALAGDLQRGKWTSCARSTAGTASERAPWPRYSAWPRASRGLAQALDKLCTEAVAAVADGCEILILSDRGFDREHAPIPSLLSCAAVHHHLLRAGTRTHTCLVVESGEPREVHDFCLLIGYGASAVKPLPGARGHRNPGWPRGHPGR